ncbi:MAG: HAMP domain-containing protein, partial [Pseudomonadota bacterium]
MTDATAAAPDRTAAPGARLGRRIALAIGLGALLLSGALALIGGRAQDDLATRIFGAATDQITTLSASTLGGATKFGKTEILESRLAQLAKANGEDVTGAAVVAASGDSLARVGDPALSGEAGAALQRALRDGVPASAEDGRLQVRPVRFGQDEAVVGALVLRWSDARIDAAVQDSLLAMIGLGALAAAALTGIGLWALHAGLSRPLLQLQKSLGRLLAGESMEIPGAGRRDEIGALARAMTDIHAQGENAARAQQAMECSSANVMIADADDRIQYVSPGLRETLRKAEGAIRKLDPDFDPDRMEGKDIHVYHKNPDHQRRMLKALSTTHKAEIRLGDRRLRLFASPIFATDGRRLGTVTEWQDRTDDLALLEEIDQTVSAIAAGDFDRRVTPQGAEDSLEKVGEQVNRISEVVGGFLS